MTEALRRRAALGVQSGSRGRPTLRSRRGPLPQSHEENAKNDGRRIISVGTTALRLLENVADISGGYENIKGGTGWADIFITPGYEFQIADGLITNFHLPKSTLLMLTSALSSTDIILDAYKVAVKNNYKFYSFGDAMLII